ncbi:CpsB/CapC family capsule biosynthesis tyrosine phosphatase [Eubacterium barkeri]|uniref:protein-tyrosine-phosphatase n=1 Tax=Eubacterium barkeri TaxID=1528 RepID=A0A1H3ET00_EUBBA|nr:CpsB/CapC family capsule biosynthesis tyrosine phosphatase [Eubacterium barkeri]SDX81765.1 protein-tyrosine phosphatase [Eubacterium barkeri]
MIDLHTHFLPGADGCVATANESLSIFKRAAALGFTDIVLSVCYLPHLGYTQSVAENAAVQRTLQEMVNAAGLHLKLHPGNEILFDNALLHRIGDGSFCPLGKGKVFLTELPRDDAVLMALLDRGYTPLLANPERYETIQCTPEKLAHYRRLGMMAQGSLLSLADHYGSAARKTLTRLLRAGEIDCLATGARDEGAYAQFDELAQHARSIVGDQGFEALMTTVPGRLLGGNPIS